VALLVAREIGAGLEDEEDLVAMATCDAAVILHWDSSLGSLEAGKRADLVVLRSEDDADPYAALLDARETDILLVLINGVPRYGIPSLMKKVGVTKGESIRVGGLDRQIYLDQKTVDPAVGKISFIKARETLEDALHRRWHMALDEMAFDDFDAAPAAGNVAPQGILAALGLAAVSLESLVSPIDLDPPTVADDSRFLDVLDSQPNLPAYLKTGLRHAFA
jgi:5-methylthioadenosine/S-adenosylhomocysteine deaminase